MSALQWILEEEGFRATPYQCTAGVWTFGHGLTSITEEESRQIVKNRISDIEIRLNKELLKRNISLDEYRKSVLIDMCYQLGFSGCLKFRKMWTALESMDYDEASKQMLDSKWLKDTKSRCELQAYRMKHGY